MNTTAQNNQDFLDLYGDALNDVIVLNEMPTFETIKSYFSDGDGMERTFEYKGRKIVAQRKFTYKGMRKSGNMYQIKTNYLHVWIQVGKSPNTMQHWKEQANGNFKTV